MKLRDPLKIIVYPHFTEKSNRVVDIENKIVFIIDRRARKSDVKNAIENLFNVKVDKVNILITSDGYKKAYVKLNKQFNASDIATKLGRV